MFFDLDVYFKNTCMSNIGKKHYFITVMFILQASYMADEGKINKSKTRAKRAKICIILSIIFGIITYVIIILTQTLMKNKGDKYGRY